MTDTMNPNLRTTILQQLEEVPDEHLAPLAQVIRYYVEGLRMRDGETSSPCPRSPLDFSGIWADMSDEEYDEVMEPYRHRGEWRSRDLDG